MKSSDTLAGSPSGIYIHQLFEAQVAQSPTATALVCEDQPLSYAALNVRANQLAHYLKKKGIGHRSIVAIMDDRELETLIAILGTFKAGGSYFSVNSQSSPEQILSALDESEARVLLTRERLAQKVPFTWLHGLPDVGEYVTVTGPRAQITDLDALPFPDQSLIDNTRYDQHIGAGSVKRSISILATRGCPYHCAYCHKIWPKRHVFRSAQNVFQEMRLHYDRGYRTFVFLDDIFNLNQRNSKDLFELVIRNNLQIRILFPNGLRGDILTPDYIDLMAEAGVAALALALETASPRLQKLIQKRIDIEKLGENLTYICEKHPNIVLDLYTMVGFPTETEQEALMTLDFIKGIKWLHFPFIFILKIFPNTDLADLAMAHGVTKEAIERSSRLAYHEPTSTTPFSKSFLRQFQANLMKDYFLLPKRLETIIPAQKQLLTREELITKYNVYLPGGLENYPDIARLLGDDGFYSEPVASIKERIASTLSVPAGKNDGGAMPGSERRLRVLLLDLSQHFSHEPDRISSWVEAPLGLMYLLTYLNRECGDRIDGKIAKAMVDFDSYEELRRLLDDFRPQVIGIRTLSLYKDFFHRAVSLLKRWAPNVPIVTGGPYATSEYATLLADQNVDLVVLGEGELTFAELVEAILEHNGKLPEDDVLERIAGLAFVPQRDKGTVAASRKLLLLDEIVDEVACEGDGDLESVRQTTDLACVVHLLEGDTPGECRKVCGREPLSPDEALETELAYWKEQLGGGPPVLQLPTSQAVQSFRGKCQPVLLNKDLTKAIKALSEQEGCNLFTTLLAAFKMLLYRCTLQEEIVVGSPITGDGQGKIGELTEFSVNLLALRTYLGDNPSFRELLSRVRKVVLNACDHQALPFGKLMRELGPEWDPSRNSPVQAVFGLQDSPTLILDLLGLSISPLKFTGRAVAFDLILSVREADQNLVGTLMYNADCFDDTTIALMLDRFMTLLEKVSMHPEWQLLEIPLPGPGEEEDLFETSRFHDAISQSEEFDFTV